MIEIVPSILSADFARLADEIARVERGGARMLHLDVMDGHFVSNLTIGPPVVESVRKCTRLHLDCHLMIEHPERYAEAFVKAGANSVSVHYEAARHPDGCLNLIKNAAEAIGESGTIRLHTRIEREFRMTAEGRRRQFLRVEVSDSGVGIPVAITR